MPALNRLETIEITDISIQNDIIQRMKFNQRKKEQKSFVRAFYIDEQFERSAKIKNCGSELIFSYGRDRKSLAHANFCKDALCPMCAWRKSIKMRENLSSIYDHLEAQGYYFLHLTLTIENPPKLEGSIDFLKNCFRRLSRSKWWKSKFDGYFYRIEITWSEKGGWHPHIHCLVATRFKCPLSESMYLDWSDELSNLWLRITGNSYITKISSGNFNEVCKYVTKFSLFEGRSDLIIEMAREISSRRMISRGGVFRGVDIEPDLTDEVDFEPEYYEICKYNEKKCCYESVFMTPAEFDKFRFSYKKGG